MRMPRVRFTVRRMMVAVAVVGLGVNAPVVAPLLLVILILASPTLIGVALLKYQESEVVERPRVQLTIRGTMVSVAIVAILTRITVDLEREVRQSVRRSHVLR